MKIFIFTLTSLKEAGQGIGSNIGLFLTIINSKVVLKEFLGPLNLTRAQALCIYKVTKVVVIDEPKDVIFAAF